MTAKMLKKKKKKNHRRRRDVQSEKLEVFNKKLENIKNNQREDEE